MKWDDKEQLKKKFVKPTGENKKIIFFKELKSTKNLSLEKSLFDLQKENKMKKYYLKDSDGCPIFEIEIEKLDEYYCKLPTV